MFISQRKKRGHCCLCRELMSIIFEDVQTAGLCRHWRRKQQYVESGEHPTANKQVKMRSMRRQCSLHSQMLGTNYQSCEQLGWRVQDKWKNDLTKKTRKRRTLLTIPKWDRHGAPNTMMDNDKHRHKESPFANDWLLRQ